MNLHVRTAQPADLQRINDIYNHYVLHSTCTYQEEPETLDGRRGWFIDRDAAHPVTVAVAEGEVVGWGALSKFRERSAYRHSVENSVYVDHTCHRRGIGSMLLADLIRRAEALGHRTILAGIDGEQAASVAIHAKFGFEPVGHFRQVGFKFGRWLDVVYLQRMLAVQ